MATFQETIRQRPFLALAPMEDVTDPAFRLICKNLGADLLCTEFTSGEAIRRDVPRVRERLRFAFPERPIGIQIFGADPEVLAEAVRLVSAAGPDYIDLNAGCWSRTHALRGECAGLLRDLPRLERILKAMVRATDLPVTLKTRLGWDERSIVVTELARMAEQAGVRLLTVHCRTRVQGYKGRADWSWLERVRKATSLPLVGNGDVTVPEDARRILETGCDGIMIGRAAVRNPWIFRQIKTYLAVGRVPEPPPLEERIEWCLSHLRLTIRHRGLRRGVLCFRKFYAAYLRNHPGIGRLRARLMETTDAAEILEHLRALQQDPAALRAV